MADRSALQVYDSNSSNMYRQQPKRHHHSRTNASAHIRFDTALESSWLPRASMRQSSEIGSDTLDWTRPTCTHELISKQNAKHSSRSIRRPSTLNRRGGSTIRSYSRNRGSADRPSSPSSSEVNRDSNSPPGWSA